MIKLSRPDTNHKFIPEIDGLRFVAIFLVVLHHQHHILRHPLGSIESDSFLWAAYVHLAKAGGLGVPLFFMISGIVLGLPFAQAHLADGSRVSLKRYFLRRVRRLEPPYLINLTVLFAIAIASSDIATLLERLPSFAASILYIHNTVYNDWSAINFVAWSLEVEAQFYLIAPLMGLLFLVRSHVLRVSLLCGIALLMSVIYALNLDGSFRYTHSILALGQYFLAGFLIAGLMVTGKLRGKHPSVMYDVIALFAFIVAICFDLGWPDPVLHAMGVVPLLVFFLCVFRGSIFLSMLRWPPVFTIGGMCYTIYLYHFWIIQAPVRALNIQDWPFGPWGILGFDILMMGLVFVVSSVLFALFERPFMNKPASSQHTK